MIHFIIFSFFFLLQNLLHRQLRSLLQGCQPIPVFTEVRPVVPPPSLLVDVEPPGTGVLVLSEGVTVGCPLGTGVFVTVGSGVVFLLLVISMEFS